MGLELDRRERHPLADLGAAAELGIHDDLAPPREALGPAVEGAVLHDGEIVRRLIVAAPIALVHRRPELAGARMEGEPHRVPEARRQEVLARAARLVTHDRRAPPVALTAEVARRSDRDVEPAVGTEGERARPVSAARWEVLDDDGGVVPAPCRRVVAEAPHAPGFGDVEPAVAEGETVGQVEVGGDGEDGVGAPVGVRVRERDDAPLARRRDEERPRGVERHEARRAEAAGELLDPEAGWQRDPRRLTGRRRDPEEQGEEQRAGQRPCHRAGRFSRNARTPSWKSWLR